MNTNTDHNPANVGSCSDQTENTIQPGACMKADGHAGARKAAADLTVALCAEAVSASLNEEAAKVDFKITFRSLFGARSLISVHCQVKSGRSYAPDQNVRGVKLASMKETVSMLQLGTQPSLIIWVEPKPAARVFWHIVRLCYPKRSRIVIPSSDTVSPTLYVDLCRQCRFANGSARPARIQISKIASPKKDLKRKALESYRLMQSGNLPSYLASKVEVTRLGWRHVTRRSRSSLKREVSFRLVPYLRQLLQIRPSRFLVCNKLLTTRGEVRVERRDVIYWYERAVLLDGNVCTVLIRISEEIEYPREWRNHGLSDSEIHVRAKLLSWWCKPTKMVGPRSSDTDTRNGNASAAVSSFPE